MPPRNNRSLRETAEPNFNHFMPGRNHTASWSNDDNSASYAHNSLKDAHETIHKAMKSGLNASYEKGRSGGIKSWAHVVTVHPIEE